MITVNAAPLEGRILLDSNNTVISITSDNGEGHYFRANISIDGELFDQQGWSRKDAYTAEKDLHKLYNAYFQTVFNGTFTNGITEQEHLLKTVAINIQELLLEDDSEVQSIDLPEFQIMYNAKPVVFDDTVGAQFLGIDAQILRISENGKLSIPFSVKRYGHASITASLTDNFGTVLNNAVISSGPGSGTRVYLYNFDFSGITLVNNTIYFTLSIIAGGMTITKPIRLITLPAFPVKELAYLNNFGFWMYAYLDGQLNIDNALDIATYDQADNTEKVFEINEEQTYTISTGSLVGTEKDIIRMITAALQAKIYFGGGWISIIPKTKKVMQYRDQVNLYSENLVFTAKENASVSNVGIDAIYPDIVLISAERSGSNCSLTFELHNGYSPASLTAHYTEGVSVTTNTGSPISPRTDTGVPDEEFTVYLRDTLDAGIFSNSITVP